MTLKYQLTKESVRKAALVQYRLSNRFKVTLAVSALCVLQGIGLAALDSFNVFNGFLLAIGIGLFLRQFYYAHRCTSALFCNRKSPSEHTISTDDSQIHLEDSTGNGHINWSSFYSLRIHACGNFIYPQKNIFIFIPATATITDGTWEEFTQLLESKIEKKI